MEKSYFVYILASAKNGTLYVGVTNNVVARTAQHREGSTGGFTKRYGVMRLVWFETHTSIDAAIHREKQIKRWRRAWKIALFSEINPEWDDLYPELAKGNWF